MTVRPLYTRLDETPEPGLPGEFPFVRGADRARDVVLGWRVTERFADDDTAASAVNEQILDACANGTSGLWLRVGEGIDADGLGAALAGVYLDLLPVTLDVGADVAAAEAFFACARAGACCAPRSGADRRDHPFAGLVAVDRGVSRPPRRRRLRRGRTGRPGRRRGARRPVRTLRVDGLDFSGGGADP